MTSTHNHLTETLVNQMDSLVEEVKESSLSLLDTIKVPRNLGQITDRLPKANYHSSQLQRNYSVPSRLGQISSSLQKQRGDLQSARPSQEPRLAPIREELRSAERGRPEKLIPYSQLG
jgi:hypothetical protein